MSAQTGPGGVGNSDGSDGQPENVVWLDASTLLLSDADPVDTLFDVSGNNNHAVQANVALQPSYNTGEINGLPTVYFDGSEYLSAPDADNLDNTTGVSVIVVAKPATTDGNPRGLVSKRDDATSQEAYYLFTYTNDYLYFNAGSDRINGNVSATTDAQIFSATFDGSISNPRSKVYNDGDESGSGNGPTSIGDMSSDLHIGILNPGYAQGFNGDIAEVIVFRNALNDAQLQIINQYINVKYGITITNDFLSPDASYVTSIAGIGEAANGEHSVTTSDGLYLEALSDLNNGDYLFASNNNLANDTSTYTTDDLTGSVESRYNRIWYLEKTNTPAARLSFDFSEASPDAQNPVNPSNYVLLHRSGLTGNFSVVKNADGVQNGDQVYFVLSEADIENGYYTLGTEDQAESPLKGAEGRTWYTLISGDWDDWEVWTLDPSGALPNNPDSLTPTTSPTSNADNVVILTGKTVDVSSDNKENNNITIDGRLDLQSTSGHDFGEIKGRGRILLSGDNFPGGDATHFISEGQGEGTVEYYGTSFTLNQALEFYDLTIDMDDAAQKLTLLADYTVNGNFRIKQGEFEINDNSSTANLNISVTGDVNVENNGKILTGSANARHQLNLYGDFTNQGTAEFTNRSSADYNNEAIDGIVDVNFLNASADQRIYCAGTTNFYRIEIDKGTDDTYELSIESTDPANFNLYGYANQGHSETAQLTDNDNALGLLRGTVKINNNVSIPVLNNTGNYNISESARLWVDGGYVAKPSGTAIVPYGKIRVSSGTLEARINSGITTRENGLIKVEGGTLNVNQIRTSVYGASHVGGYNQSGGTVNVYGGNSATDWYVFNLTYGGNVFIMSGGTLHIHEAHGKGGIFIASDEANQNVTGGTVIMDINDGNDFEITSKAPFWDLIIRNTDGGTGKHILTEAQDVGGLGINLDQQDLVVLNDLTIETGTTRTETAGGESNTYGSYLDLVPDNVTASDLYVGRNLTIGDSTVLDVWGWTGIDNSTSATVYFNSSKDAVLSIGDITSYTNALLEYESPNISDGGPDGNFPTAGTGEMHTWKYNLPLYNLIVDKPGGKMSLAANSPGKGGSWGNDPGQDGNWVCSNGGKNTRRWLSQLLSIKNQFKLLNGTFSQIDPYNTITIVENGGGTYGSVGDPVGYSVNFYTTDVEIRDTMFVYEEGTTPKEGIIEVRAPNPLTLQTTDNAFIGNMRFIDDHNNPVTLVSDVHFGRIEYFNGTIDIGSHNLKIDLFETFAVNHPLRMDGVSSGQPVFEVPNFIRMDGNASDGGVSLKVPKQPTWPLPNKDEYEYLSRDNEQGPYAYPDRLWFPIGTDASGSDKYTPAVCRLHDYGTIDGDEYITVRVVDQELQTTDLAGGDVLSYYWNVDFEGYASGEEPTVSWIFQYDDSDLDVGGGNESAFVPGKVLDGGDYTRSDEGGTSAVKNGGASTIEGNILGNDPANIVIFNGTGTSGSTDPDDNIETISSTMFNEDASGPNINTNWQNAWPNTGFTLENANYTAGESNRFVGAPTIYYSQRNSGWGGFDWDNNASWYDAPTGTNNPPDYPTAGDIAVIRGNNGQDGINVSGTQEAAEVIMQREGTYTDIEDLPRLRFAPNDQLTAGKISGVGDLYLQQDIGNGPLLNADIGEFADNDTSLVDFYLLSDNGTYNVDLVDFFDVLPTLRIYGNNANYNRIVSFNYDMSLKNLIVDGEAVMKMAGNYTVENRTRLGYTGGGRIEYPNGTNSYTLKTGEFVTGRGKNQQDNTFRVTVDGGGGNGIEHTFEVERDINLNFPGTVGGEGSVTFDLFSAMNDNNVILKLSGTGDYSFIDNYSPGNSTIDLYKIEMNKGSDTTSTFTFEDDFTLNGPTSGAGVDKAIELQNGRLILNDPDINVDLTTGDDDFYIPGTAGLEVRQGQANANGGSGILLDGKLQVSGGTVDMSGGDNYIQYSSSGNATMEISDGDLIVGSHIRRGLTSGEGILTYNQSGGNVIVGNDEAPENNRALFEILNTGSEFNHSGGNLIIGRAQDNPSIASLYLDPDSYSFSGNTNIQFGYTNTPAGDEMGIYATIPLPNIKIDNTTGSNHTLKQWTIPLTITDSLEINAGATYDANGLDLTLQGDLIANGDFVADLNTTIFNSAINQQIVGSPVFYNLTKNASGTLNLNNDITIENVLNASDGVISDNANDITVMGNVYFDATHQWGGAGNGILMEGTATQNLYASGTLGKLSVNNSEGIFVPEGYTVFIDDALQLESGVLDIGKNLLELDEDAVIIEANAFSENNMIQTNISFTDAGVKKFYPAIVPADNFNFTYPIGSEGKYTPVSFSINEKDAGGYIRVKGANEMHPTITNDDEPCQEIHDTSNVLKYHWLLEASGVSNFTASANMKYYEEDYQLDNSKTGTSYSVNDYITARLLLGSTLWNKFGPDDFDENNQLLVFDFSNTDDDGISGEYTAGVEDQGGTCEGAIPDEVPSYISIQDGGWTDVSTWDTYPVSGGSIPSGGPRGAIVIVEHNVTVPNNYIVSYKTTINNTGLLDIGTTFGHRLGIVDGTGTLKLERGNLPAGVYDDFFSRSGGTIEFAGSDDYDVLSEVNNVRNLKFSGTGERRWPNLDFEVYGVLTIDGDDANLHVINEHDRIVTLDSNVVFTHGSFDAGVGSSKVIMNGTSLQTITGSFEVSNAFNYLTIQNSSGLEILDSIEVDQTFTLNNGMVYLPDSALVTLNSTSSNALTGASSSRYIQGSLRKNIQNGDTYTFEIGDTSRYGKLELSNTSPTTAEFWEVQYYNNETHPTYDTSSYESSLERISNNEYWRVKGPGTTSDAFVKIRWDDQSVLPAQTSNRSVNLRIAEWNTGASEWQSVGSDVTDNGVTSGTVRTNSAVTLEEHVFTLASTEPNPQATAAFSTEDTAVCVNETIQLTATFSGQGDITFTINKDGTPYDTIIASSEGDTTFIINSSAVLGDAGDYSIDSVGDDNGTGYVYGDPVTVTVSSLPAVYNVIGGGTVCDDDSVEIRLDGSVAGINYELYRNSTYTGIVVGGTGDTISFGYFGDAADNGNYEVLAINSSTGCEQYMNGVVNVTINTVPDPEPYINETNPICYNESNITLYANDVNSVGNDFSWTPAIDLDDASAENPDYLTSNPATPSDTTMFNVTVTDTGTGCQATDSVQVILLHRPETGNQYYVPNEFDK